jgi:hypothetical protein
VQTSLAFCVESSNGASCVIAFTWTEPLD